MSEGIVKGSVVQLKSGGPSMTVTKVDYDGGESTVYCTWFDDTEQKRGHFPMEAVELD